MLLAKISKVKIRQLQQNSHYQLINIMAKQTTLKNDPIKLVISEF